MKKIIGLIAIIISFALLANSKVSATSLETEVVNNNLLSKQDVIQILDASQTDNINIDLAPISITEMLAKTEIKMAKTTDKRQTIANEQVNADE